MSAADTAKAAALVFFAAIVQVTLLSSVDLLGGTPDLVLVTLVGVALLRGSIVGAVAGFAAGLIVDTANLQTLGVTSLLLTLAGYWIGRYGETTGRDRAHAPFLSVAVVTVLYAFGALFLHYMLGDPASARIVLVDSLPAKLLFNLLLTLPVYALVRRLLAPVREEHAEVQLLG
ncbi:MAG: rod shape-determining protein MreD [Gaiellaceae bacterium]